MWSNFGARLLNTLATRIWSKMFSPKDLMIHNCRNSQKKIMDKFPIFYMWSFKSRRCDSYFIAITFVKPWNIFYKIVEVSFVVVVVIEKIVSWTTYWIKIMPWNPFSCFHSNFPPHLDHHTNSQLTPKALETWTRFSF